MAIFFHLDSITEKLTERKRIKNWIIKIIEAENKKPGQIDIILTSDAKLLEINKKYLCRNYYTDIITFDYSEGAILNGDMFISVERVRENASKFNNSVREEMLRVIIHGILHLLGYRDRSGDEKKAMRQMEDVCLKTILTGP